MIRETARTVTLPSGDVLTPADFESMADEVLTNPPEFAPVNPKGGRPSLADGISPTLRVRIDETTRQRLADREQRTSFENSSNTGSPPNRNPDDDWDPNVLQPRLDKDTFTKLAARAAGPLLENSGTKAQFIASIYSPPPTAASA